jgi:hypothetical protein
MDESFADEMLSVASRRSPAFKTPKRISTKQLQPITMGPLDPYEFPLRQEDDQYRYGMIGMFDAAHLEIDRLAFFPTFCLKKTNLHLYHLPL